MTGVRSLVHPRFLLLRALQTRMVAAEATLSMTPEATTLLSFLRAHKSLFSPGDGYNATTAALMRKNDTGKSAVPSVELDTNAFFLPGKPAGEALLAHWDEVVEVGRASLAASLPGVAADSDVGKVLYYDVLMLLRIISYGVLVQNVNFLHENNMAMIVALYDVRCSNGGGRRDTGCAAVRIVPPSWFQPVRSTGSWGYPCSVWRMTDGAWCMALCVTCSFSVVCVLWGSRPSSGVVLFCLFSPQEMSVPAAVMPMAVRAMKDATLQLISKDVADGTAACFEEVALGLTA